MAAARPLPTLTQLELRCPPLPHTLVEALDLMERPDDITVRSVTAIVERDPVVVARLLQRVNSAYYGLQRTISSVERAVVLLGPVPVVGMVAGLGMIRLRSVLAGPAGDCFTRLIAHCTATAYLTRHLAEALPSGGAAERSARSGAALTAGLLHDFGKIILVYNFPEEAVSLYEDRALAEHVALDDLREIERLLFGCDHTEAGEFAAHRLRFPAPIVRAIRHHHDVEAITAGPDDDRLLRVVAAGNLAAQTLGYAFGGEVSDEACLASPVWEALLRRDLAAAYASPEALLADLRAGQSELDGYVSSFAPPAPAPSR